jgi:lipopolysaccharide transport system ATP-binding protein
MQAITRLCSRAILLHEGRIKLDGAPGEVANAYLRTGVTTTAVREWPDIANAPGDHVVRLCAVRIRSEGGEIVDAVDIRKSVGVEIEYEVLLPDHSFLVHFSVLNQEGAHLFVGVDTDPVWRGRRRPTGRYISTGWIPGNLLAEGLVSVRAVLMTWNPEVVHAAAEDAVAFRVLDDLTARDTARGDYSKAMPGLIRPLLRWTTQQVPSRDRAETDPWENPEKLVSQPY